jgi:hypothetical protein
MKLEKGAPQNETGETQPSELQEQKKENFREKINRLVGSLGAKLVEFSQRKQAAKAIMESVNPEADFTPEEQEQLSAIESSAQLETEKATALLQEAESGEPAESIVEAENKEPEVATAEAPAVEKTEEVIKLNKELPQEEQAKEKIPEQPKTPEERVEALKQKAETLTENATQNLINQFGSVEAAQNYAKRQIRDPYGRTQNPLEISAIYFARANLTALEKTKELQGYIEQGHEDYSHIPPLYKKISFESEMNETEQNIDRNNYSELPEAKGAFEQTKEQQVEKLTTQAEDLLQKFESTNKEANERYQNLKSKGLIRGGSDFENADYQKHIAYEEIGDIKEALEKNAEYSVHINENGKVQASYPPFGRFVGTAEDRLSHLEKVLSGSERYEMIG